MWLLFQDMQTLPEEGVETQSALDVILQSGTVGIAIMVILLVLFFLAVFILVERYLTISKAGRVDQNFMNNIRASVQSGNIEGARALCRNTDSPMARMVEKGLQRIGKPLGDIDAAIENVGNLEVFRLEKNLSRLASIAGAAPMIGFFGTVTGMILAFYQMSTAEDITPKLLAGGIYQALLTTAGGLFVGILAFIGYNLLVSLVEKVIFQMERTTVEFMDLLQEPA
ncbi:MAG TPA: MotA/TolQ/ExbB proton channel family protein [Saprospiraceae bacterium]|nr:MotA/TolQ/ExbB proton channel family protein [Saprospiraceae bacterium]MCB9272147.1 MotA/TolQ/ExbB proton channel family protein [Lewinellaceae bacterium]MCB0673236.1 MotA/TolQ/ExbB proton channel family protein [Saprospiraceae bacterium]MCB9319956.1 MotA/TolQ/ExbB proton channel family protein [Lewinellaceae bacterium]HPG06468.1 MotA/TolQ/ExbB proton channel family protein [Saprospiraceae bacterium]